MVAQPANAAAHSTPLMILVSMISPPRVVVSKSVCPLRRATVESGQVDEQYPFRGGGYTFFPNTLPARRYCQGVAGRYLRAIQTLIMSIEAGSDH
ncbi:hypothetical protein CO2235_180020 [Cupriavidus oxalaticus]|uniref:Uncharacterized protein n=1 Tax=Cupriavidus oxalaticus TaxID=96344 RepID=A0A375G305_9BURK|nr:hypothetical protein CO2235_180020 [Cupriavidus oxalaticus]